MFKHFIIACNLVALSGLVNAATPSAGSRIDVNACITSTRAEGDLYTVELVGGTRVEISKTADGTPAGIRVVQPDGEAASVTRFDALATEAASAAAVATAAAATEAAAAQDTEGAPVAPEGLARKGKPAAEGAANGAARSETRSKHQRMLSNQLRQLVRAYCKRAPTEDAAALKPGGRGAPDPATDWLLWPDLLEERAFWFSEAHYQVEDTFYAGMDDWSHDIGNWIDDLRDKHKNLPACSAVRDDCRSTCDRVGTYAGGVVCGSLAAVASALSAGIGVSVGVYCGGKVLLKIEECRFNCVVPGVPCSN